MASLRDLKKRIKSVEGIIKVTNAMYIISAARMKKYQEKAERIRKYEEKIAELMASVGNTSETMQASNEATNKQKNIVLLVFATQRGLAGSLPNNIYRYVLKYIQEVRLNKPTANIKIVNIGKKFQTKLKFLDAEILADFSDVPEIPTAADIRSISKTIYEQNKNNDSEIIAIYPESINAFNQNILTKKIFPVEQKQSENTGEQIMKFKFEPNQEAIMTNLIHLYIENLLYLAKAETVSSEYSARMVSMKSAKENASEVKDYLNSEYNKTRQTQITNEIAQIVSGASV